MPIVMQATHFQRKPITHAMGWDRCVSYPVTLKALSFKRQACLGEVVMGSGRSEPAA